MIAKITRGARPGDIAAYLHGPGKANEHFYYPRSNGTAVQGGKVIGGNLFREGDTSGDRWAAILRSSLRAKPDIKNGVWQVSLRNTTSDRVLSDTDWGDAAQTFAEAMGYEAHPWVVVRHADDHVHIVVSRVAGDGSVWHARNDYRSAQSAASALEREYGLERAPRTKTTRQRSASNVVLRHRQEVSTVAERRRAIARSRAGSPMVPRPGRGAQPTTPRQTRPGSPLPERGIDIEH